MEAEIIDKLMTLAQYLISIVGVASMLVAAARAIADITPNTKDDRWVSKAEKVIAAIVAVLDRLALNPDDAAARRKKQGSHRKN